MVVATNIDASTFHVGHLMQQISSLNRTTLMFPLALVIFEFSVYIANDMIQPGMLTVTQEFGAHASWIASSMTAFLLGGALFQWLFGPLSDRIGRRPVMLGGTLFFILSCLATLFCTNIQSFILLRVAQGVGLCFISAVGYAVVQEAFEERAAVKVTALMANVALIAPLIGPVAGAFIIEFWSWHMVFVFIAVIAFASLIGLILYMPETIVRRQEKHPLTDIWRDYHRIFTNRHFLMSTFTIPLLALPLIGWIALSPVILVADGHLSVVAYGLWQIPIFSSLIAGNLILARQADRWRLGMSVKLALYPIGLGVFIMLIGAAFTDLPHFLMAGMSLLAFAEGLSTAVLFRFTLTASDISKGTVAASIGMVSMLTYSIGIELYKLFYLYTGILGFALLSALSMLAYWLLSCKVVQRAMLIRQSDHTIQNSLLPS